MSRVTTARELGALMRERRRERGWSQQELATRLGVSRQWIVEVEKGKPRAELGLVLRALTALDLTVNVEARAADLVDLDALLERARGGGRPR